jgi:hypothetical protein
MKSPNKLISFSVVFMSYWAGLHNPSNAENISAGAEGLIRLVAGAAATPPLSERQTARGILRSTDETMVDPNEYSMEIDGYGA